MRYLLVFILVICGYCYGQDTVSVVIQYSDTALTELVGIDDNGNEYIEIGYDEYCYWRKGFLVGDIFLDETKKQIPKTNIVWQYKIVK